MNQPEAPPHLPELPPGMPPQGQWTYEDYCRLPEDGRRYEVIRGVLFMSPAPRISHQRAILTLASLLRTHVHAKGLGEAFVAPVDVNIPGLTSPVEPDVIFVARGRLHIVAERFLSGVPDLVMEVLSRSNPTHDRRTKFKIYEEAGIQEYWIIDLKAFTIEIYTFESEAYRLHQCRGKGEWIQSKLLDGFEVEIDEVCAG